MNPPSRKRLSFSPEKLILAGRTYSNTSDCARTFFILGEAVVWSRAPHQQILACFRKMTHVEDRRTAREYAVNIAGTLDQETFERFRNSLTGVLGANRRRNKAGRIWLRIPDEDATPVAVISFWAKRASITPADIHLLRRAFHVKLPTWVDYIDRAKSTFQPA